MARKPVHLKPAKGRTTGREAIWAAIRELKTFTGADLEKKTRQNMDTIRTYMRALAKAHYIEESSSETKKHYARNYTVVIWQLVKDIGVEAPRLTNKGEPVTQGRNRENMWRAMKMINEFDYLDLAVHASTEEHPVSHEDAKDYIKYLHKAGYIVMTQPGKAGRAATATKARYRFVPSKNTGPLAPMVQRIKHVYDPNLGEVVWTPDPEGEEA